MFFLLNTGLTVVIRSPDSNNTNSTTGGTALPKFAIRGMLKTFGLHGVVLDVDSVSTKHNAFVEIVAKNAGKYPHMRTRWLGCESADAKTKVYHQNICMPFLFLTGK